MENQLTMYATYDRLAETYAAPFVLDPKVANRMFDWMKKETEAKDRQDKEIRVVGYWNSQTGEVKPANVPMKVYELDDTGKEADNG